MESIPGCSHLKQQPVSSLMIVKQPPNTLSFGRWWRNDLTTAFPGNGGHFVFCSFLFSAHPKGFTVEFFFKQMNTTTEVI